MSNLIKGGAYLLACLAFCKASAGAAEDRKVLAHYQTRLSERDHVGSNGQRLKTAAAILQRDREHIYDSHRGKKNEYQDLEDVPDTYFATKERIAGFEQALARGHIDDATVKAVLTTTPFVDVTVYRDAGGTISVDVKFVRGGKTAVEESF